MTALDLLKKITSLAAPTANDTSESIRDAIDIGQRAVIEGDGEIAQLAVRREALLVDGSDKEIDAVDAVLSSARRARDRIDARLKELSRRLEVAEKREHAALLDAAYARGLHLAAEEERLTREYWALAKKLRENLYTWRATSAERAAAAKFLIDAGDPRRIRSAYHTAPDVYLPGVYPLTIDGGHGKEHDALMAAARERVRAAVPAK